MAVVPYEPKAYIKNSLFVRNLSPQVSESTLREVFAQCDEIERVLFRAYPNATNLFFAQIDFRSSKGVIEGTKLSGTMILGVACICGVIDPLTQNLMTQVEGQTMYGASPVESSLSALGQEAQGVQAEYLKKAREEAEDQRLRTLHISGFEQGVTEEALKTLCEKFGEVKALVINNEGDAPFALIEFKEKGPAHVCKTQREFLVDGRVFTFSEAKTMVDATEFAERGVHFQQPIFDAYNMRQVLAQQGNLNAKLVEVRKAAQSIFNPSDGGNAADQNIAEKPLAIEDHKCSQSRSLSYGGQRKRGKKDKKTKKRRRLGCEGGEEAERRRRDKKEKKQKKSKVKEHEEDNVGRKTAASKSRSRSRPPAHEDGTERSSPLQIDDNPDDYKPIDLDDPDYVEMLLNTEIKALSETSSSSSNSEADALSDADAVACVPGPASSPAVGRASPVTCLQMGPTASPPAGSPMSSPAGTRSITRDQAELDDAEVAQDASRPQHDVSPECTRLDDRRRRRRRRSSPIGEYCIEAAECSSSDGIECCIHAAESSSNEAVELGPEVAESSSDEAVECCPEELHESDSSSSSSSSCDEPECCLVIR